MSSIALWEIECRFHTSDSPTLVRKKRFRGVIERIKKIIFDSLEVWKGGQVVKGDSKQIEILASFLCFDKQKSFN